MQEEQQHGGWLPPDSGGAAGVQPSPGQPLTPPDPAWQQQQPPGWQQQPQPPPGYWWPQQQQRPPWQYQADTGPGNGNAVAGFVLSVAGACLLLFFVGLSAPITLVCGALGIWFSLKGRRAVDRGETQKHRGLAQAGFVIGIVTVVLSVLAIIGWVILFTADVDFGELDNGPDGNPLDGDEFDSATLLRAAALVAAKFLL